MSEKRENHPEPVPAASQLAVLPFLAAADGVLTSEAGTSRLRITMHRVTTREGEGYLQQACTYLGSDPNTQDRVGRMFSIDTGIMGEAFKKRKILRTRRYDTLDALRADLAQDLVDTGDSSKIEEVAVSYVAIPFLGRSNEVILTLYADCSILNFFADDERVRQLVVMCRGFCKLFDWLDREQPFDTLRNFPLERGNLKRGKPTVFRRLQEEMEFELPRFHNLDSFNYDAAVG